MDWSSQKFYYGRLTAHESVAKHLLSDLDGVTATEVTLTPLLLIDTSSCNLEETTCDETSRSRANIGECEIVSSHVEKLISLGLSPIDIAVISPYSLQVDLLHKSLSHHKDLEIKKVELVFCQTKDASMWQ